MNTDFNLSQKLDAVHYRRAQGAGGSQGLSEDSIELDYDSRMALGISDKQDPNGFYPCDVKISRSTRFEVFLGHWANPRVEYRFAFRLAVVSVGLGLVGTLLGVAGLVVSFR